MKLGEGLVDGAKVRKMPEELVAKRNVVNLKNRWVWNLKTKQCIFSEAWCKNLGFEPEEIEHHEDTWKALVHADCLPNVMDNLLPVLSGEIEFYKFRYRLRNRNNKYIWHLDTGRVTERDQNGEAVLMEGYDIPIAC